jgi:hypothetical protein
MQMKPSQIRRIASYSKKRKAEMAASTPPPVQGKNSRNSVFLAIGLLVAIGLLAAFAIYKAKKASHHEWAHLTRGTAYAVPPGYDVGRLERALDKVTDLSSRIYPPQEVKRIISGAQITVARDMSWKDGTGQEVGGQSFGSAISVANDMGPLQHEFNHVFEKLIDNKVDIPHAGWEKRGLAQLDREFRAWLHDQTTVGVAGDAGRK